MRDPEKNGPRNGGYYAYRFDCNMYVDGRGWVPLFTSGTILQAMQLAKFYSEAHKVQLCIDDVMKDEYHYVPEKPANHPAYPSGFRKEQAPGYGKKKEEAAEAQTTKVEKVQAVLPEGASAKELAIALYKQIDDKPKTARKIADLAGADYDHDDRVKGIFKKLKEGQKIVCVEGRWTRVKSSA